MLQRRGGGTLKHGPGTWSTWRKPVSLSSSCLLQCSKSCGGGHRRRALRCEDHDHREFHEMYCANLIRPPDVESCNSQACEVVWITGEWTEVTAQWGRF